MIPVGEGDAGGHGARGNIAYRVQCQTSRSHQRPTVKRILLERRFVLRSFKAACEESFII